MPPPDLKSFLHQQPQQHPTARERELHAQLVPSHRLLHNRLPGNGSGASASGRHRPGLVIDSTPADPRNDGLTADAEPRGGIDPLFALPLGRLLRNRLPGSGQQTRLAERAGQKIVLPLTAGDGLNHREGAPAPRSSHAGFSRRLPVPRPISPRPRIRPWRLQKVDPAIA